MNSEILSSPESQQRLLDVQEAWMRALLPPPKLTVSQWADQYRKLSPEASAEHGDWDTSRAEYQRGMMDVLTDPTVVIAVYKTSAQIGKTEIKNNMIGYCIDQDPSPILTLEPTLDMAKAWSKDRFAPMLRDTPCLTDKVGEDKSRDSGNTLLHKSFPGGHISMAGANSPASLASRPIRRVFGDEVDRYPASAGDEGDPVDLAKKRTTTFWNRFIALFSTPTNKGTSRIDQAFELSDKRFYFIPCPDCGEFQTLKWANFKQIDENGQAVYFNADTLNEIRYLCEYCGSLLSESEKPEMIRCGEWRATAPFNGVAGFHIWEGYSPWVRWVDIVKSFLQAKERPDTLKVWVNTSLGETWEEEGEEVDENSLTSRREKYPAPVPMGAFVLTAGVDIQKDRIEVEVNGWGLGEENWGIEYAVLYGDTDKADVWNMLDSYLSQHWQHESGIKLQLSATCIDSGFNTSFVYDFCKGKEGRRIFAVKGDEGDRPIAGPPSEKRTGENPRPVKLFIVGVDPAKEIIYSRLRKAGKGPGAFHFPETYTEEYFRQLTAEKVVTKYIRGYPYRKWVRKRARAEALDCKVYAYAGLKLLPPNWEDWEVIIPKNPDAPPIIPQKRVRRVRHRGIER